MKPSLQFSVPCLNIPEDETKPPTFEHIFYELPSPDFPFRLDFFLANGWCAGQGRFIQEVRLLQPDGSTLVQTGQQPFELGNPNQPYMVVNKFQGFEFGAPGIYRIQVILDGEVRLDYPLEIRRFEPAGSGAKPEAAAAPSPQPPSPAPTGVAPVALQEEWNTGDPTKFRT